MSARRTVKVAATADRILDVAEGLVQVQGWNGFSYADISTAIGIRKASLHHHFATKEALGVSLIARYHQRFFSALDAIASDSDKAVDRLTKYAGLYESVLRKGRMCLCGMLAIDAITQPKSMRTAVSRFFTENERWLAMVFREGQRANQIRLDDTPQALASFWVSSLEGAMMVARVGRGNAHFKRVAKRLLASIPTPGART